MQRDFDDGNGLRQAMDENFGGLSGEVDVPRRQTSDVDVAQRLGPEAPPLRTHQIVSKDRSRNRPDVHA